MKNVKQDFAVFKKAVLKSVERPEFLKDSQIDLPTAKNLAWNAAFNILCLFSDGISETNLTKQKIRLISKQIEDITNQLDQFLDDKQLLYVWVFIGTEIESWIELCADREFYESSANLKKILETFFND